MCAFVLPFALRMHASIAEVSLALRRSFVICPLRNRSRSAPEIRNFARSERSRKIALSIASHFTHKARTKNLVRFLPPLRCERGEDRTQCHFSPEDNRLNSCLRKPRR